MLWLLKQDAVDCRPPLGPRQSPAARRSLALDRARGAEVLERPGMFDSPVRRRHGIWWRRRWHNLPVYSCWRKRRALHLSKKRHREGQLSFLTRDQSSLAINHGGSAETQPALSRKG